MIRFCMVSYFTVCTALSVAAFEAKVKEFITADTIVTQKGKKIKLAGILPHASGLKRIEVLAYLQRRLKSKKVFITKDKIVHSKKAMTINAYVSFICDTCGKFEAPPEFKKDLIVTTHTIVKLNQLLLKQNMCTADTASKYEKKNLFMYLDSRNRPIKEEEE